MRNRLQKTRTEAVTSHEPAYCRRETYRGLDQVESVWWAAEVVRCGMYWKVEVTGFTDRLDVRYEIRSQR